MHRLTMQLLVDSRERSNALLQFATCRRLLYEGLGVLAARDGSAGCGDPRRRAPATSGRAVSLAPAAAPTQSTAATCSTKLLYVHGELCIWRNGRPHNC
jgi:hypothetical protein